MTPFPTTTSQRAHAGANRSHLNQAIEERPREDEARQPPRQAPSPEVEGAAEVAAGVEGRAALGGGVGGDLEGVEEQRGHGGEDQVDEEAGVRLEAQDAGGDAEQRRGQALQVGEDLREKTSLVSGGRRKGVCFPRARAERKGRSFGGWGSERSHTLVLCMTDSGTMGWIWYSRSDAMMAAGTRQTSRQSQET